ncbi:branched-chain amino acid transport system substrate-binding protein [Rhodoligotrophos appendicifer]|uniref:ABC transporter substrate-binding protein n=1 Tax=Rhodoligotrophos appendicifer TaxID=987056 RepID=UPI001479333A|nr:ABC transporter substrate-binding protein [Rhodoligotrophos appendicifer]
MLSRRKIMVRGLSVGLMAMGLLVLPYGQDGWAQDKTPIKIGLVASLSGPLASVGIPQRDAVTAVVNNINSQGGIGGHAIELVVFDDGTNPTEAARGTTELIQQDKVVAIVGPTSGSNALALSPVAARFKVPVAAMVASVPVISKKNNFYPWVFRGQPDDKVTTSTMLQNLADSGVKRIGVFYQEDAYGKFTADFVSEVASKYGLEVVDMVNSSLTATDLTAQATKLRNAGAEAVIVQVSPPTLAASFARAAKQVGLKAPLWGGIGFGQKAFAGALGKDGDGIRAMLLGNWDDPAPDLKRLADLLAANGKTPAGFPEISSTNALLHVVKALESDPSATGETLRAAMEKVCNLQTYAASTACFSAEDHNGWTAKALVPAEIQSGKYVTLK